MIDRLYRLIGPKLETKVFEKIFDVLIFINPIALLPQVYTAVTAGNVEGISIAMMWIFAAVQLVVCLQGIKIKSSSMFLSMALSLMASVSIIVIVSIRS